MYVYQWFKVKLKNFDLTLPEEYIFRGMTRKESDIFLTLMEQNSFELFGKTHSLLAYKYCLNVCVKGDYNWDEAPLGLMIGLVSLIRKTSLTNQQIFEVAFNYLQTPHGLSESKCVMVMPGMTFEFLSNCDPLEYAKTILYGEQLFDTIYPENPETPLDTPPLPGEVRKTVTTTTLGKKR